MNCPFAGLHFVSEKRFGLCRQLILMDDNEKHFQRFFNGRMWGAVRPYEFLERAKIRKLYDDLTGG